jgi:outer membrane protein, adhesin transport system
LALDATKYDAFDSSANYDVRARVQGRYPIFSGGQRSARIGQARQRSEAALQAEALTRSEATRDASIAFERLKALEAQVETLRRAVVASNRARDFFVEQFKVARGSLLDLLQAEQDSFETMLEHARATTQLDLARYQLMEQTGELLPAVGVSFSFATAREILGDN